MYQHFLTNKISKMQTNYFNLTIILRKKPCKSFTTFFNTNFFTYARKDMSRCLRSVDVFSSQSSNASIATLHKKTITLLLIKIHFYTVSFFLSISIVYTYSKYIHSHISSIYSSSKRSSEQTFIFFESFEANKKYQPSKQHIL